MVVHSGKTHVSSCSCLKFILLALGGQRHRTLSNKSVRVHEWLYAVSDQG